MDHKIVKIIVIIAFLVSGFVTSAQNQVKGSLADAKSGDAMMYVNCVLLKTQDSSFAYGATSDEKGHFAFKQVAAGDYLLRVSYIGYDTYWQNINVKGNADLGRIALLKSATVLNAVTVTAKKPLYAVDGEKNMYNTTEDPSIQNGSASDALQNAPGVEVDAEGNITLRGVSSVEIWINDRPSHMNEEALKQYIKQLPANAIDRIEVITNPSARYSTTGGVINIVTNQKVKRNEFFSLGFRANTMPSLSPWASYVYANEKFDMNVYVNANVVGHNSYADGTSTLYKPGTDTVSRYQSHYDTTRSHNYGGYTGLNFNWKINDKTHLATWAGVYPYWGRSHSTIDLDYFEYPSPLNLGYRYEHSNDDGMFWGGYLGAWLEHRFDTTGRKLSLSLNGNTSNTTGTSYSTYAYRDLLRDTLHRRDESYNHNPHLSLSLDYVHPLKHDLELAAGATLGYAHSSNGQAMDTLGAAGSYDNIALRSYDAATDFQNAAAYATLQKRWGGFTAKLGLRFEEDFAKGYIEHPSVGDRVPIDTAFSGFVPSIHLSYQTKKFTSYSLSYTRRFAHDEDFSKYYNFNIYDDYSYATGNPNLRMNYTHTLEAAFNKYIMKFGNVGLNAYMRLNENEIGTMTYAGYAPAYFPATQIVNYTRPENIGSSHTEGIEANITYRPTGFLNVRFNASVFNYGYNYEGFRDSKVSWSARLNVWAKLWNKLEVFANARYSSPRIGLYSLTVANKSVDFGVSSDFFDRKMSVFLNVNDIFGMAQWGSNTTAPQYQTTGSQSFDSRFVSLGLTFRFGKMELESKARQGATDTPMGKS